MEKNNKNRSLFVKSLLKSGKLLLFCLIFTLFGLLFLYGEDINPTLRIIIGVAFMAPICILFFIEGSKTAENEFAIRNKMITDKFAMNPVPFWFSVVLVIPFVVLLFLLTIVGNLSGFIVFQTMAMLLLSPIAMIFKAVGLFTMTQLSWYSVLMVAIFFVISLTFYFIGFIRKEREKEKGYKQVAQEIWLNSRAKN